LEDGDAVESNKTSTATEEREREGMEKKIYPACAQNKI
jgi:hypothetical protein